MTNAFYFGPDDSPLFGFYHEPLLGQGRRSGVVLCYPFGQEYIRSHRSYQKLATQLSRVGLHVLRFDYHGSGDSSGASDAGSLGRWVDDIQAAIIEIKECGGIDEVSLVGLRLGATLAARAAMGEASASIKNLVLWEPVINGRKYVEELLHDHRDWFNDLLPAPPHNLRDGAGAEIQGFPLTDRMRGELENIDLLAVDDQRASRVLLVEADDRTGLGELNGHLRKLGVHTEYRSVAAPKIWKQVGLDLALIPHDSLQCISSWIDEVSS